MYTVITLYITLIKAVLEPSPKHVCIYESSLDANVSATLMCQKVQNSLIGLEKIRDGLQRKAYNLFRVPKISN